MLLVKIVLTVLLIIIMTTDFHMEDDFVTNVAASLYIISLICIILIWIS